jgi:hypothetical protein
VPIARYFIIVGGTLAALLLIAGWCLPTPPAMFANQLAIDRSIIRIKSARKWPEKVVLNTSQPTITPPAVEEPPVAQSVRLPPDEAGDQSNLEALAQLKPDAPSAAVHHPTLRIKHGLARTARKACGQRSRYTSASKSGSGDCCQFGWIDNGQTSSNAMSRRHAASSWPMDWRRSHREELKDKQLLSSRTELRSYRLNGSGMNKIVRTTSATLCSIKRRNVHVQTCNRCSDSACCRLVVDNPFCSGCNI